MTASSQKQGGYGGWYPFSFNGSQNAHQYWRINQTNGNSLNGHLPRVGEIEFYATGKFVPPTTLEWNTNDVGSWNDITNWEPSGGPPSTTQQTAPFGTVANITGPTTTVTNSTVTVNRVEFENATHSYAVAGLGSVNLLENINNGTPPSFDVLAGNHEFQVRVNLDADTSLDTASNSSLQFNHQLDLGGNTLTKTGLGTVTFNNDLVTGPSGGVMCEEGICAGIGTINGDVVNLGGTLSPGNVNVNGVAGVPEPTSVLLFSAGLVLPASSRRKRR